MALPPAHNLLLTLSSLCLLFSLRVDAHNRPPVVATPLVSQTCQAVPFPDVCLFALTSGSISLNLNVGGLARVSVEGAIRKTTTANLFIGGLLNKPHTPAVQQVLAECKGNHAQAAILLRSAVKELASPFGRLNACNFIDAAVWEVQRCEAKCQKQATEQNLLTARNEDFVKFCVNAKAIISMPTLL